MLSVYVYCVIIIIMVKELGNLSCRVNEKEKPQRKQ